MSGNKEIRLSNSEADILARVKAKDLWSTLREAGTVRQLIGGLGIMQDEIGGRCARHFKRLARKKYTSMNEIIDGCPTLKKRLHASKEQQIKAEKDRIRKAEEEKKKAEDPTQQLLKMMQAQGKAQQQAETSMRIGRIDTLLTQPAQYDTFQQRQLAIGATAPADYRAFSGKAREEAKLDQGVAEERWRAWQRGDGPAFDRVLYGPARAAQLPPPRHAPGTLSATSGSSPSSEYVPTKQELKEIAKMEKEGYSKLGPMTRSRTSGARPGLGRSRSVDYGSPGGVQWSVPPSGTRPGMVREPSGRVKYVGQQLPSVNVPPMGPPDPHAGQGIGSITREEAKKHIAGQQHGNVDAGKFGGGTTSGALF
jgi:predicted  nucleic acid-binding Zn-ribbon protein